MSTKYVLAAAAVAVVAVEAQESRPLSNMRAQVMQPQVLVHRPTAPLLIFDEEQSGWSANAGISGGAGGRPQWNVGISKSWEEEQVRPTRPEQPARPTRRERPAAPVRALDEEQADWQFNAGIQGQVGQPPSWNVGISAKWDEEEQKVQLKKLKNTIHSIQRASKKAEQVRNTAAALDEEQADWQFNAGIQGQVGQPPSWNVGISAKWDEEQAYTTGAVNKEDFNINLNHKSGDKGDWRTALEKAYDLAKEAQKNGFFDEEQADWAVNAGISGGAGGRPQYNAGVSVRWDEEQSWNQIRPIPIIPFDEQQATGEFNAGISGGAGGRPTYNAGVTIRWEEEEEQRNLLKKINNALGKVDNVVSTVNHVAATTQSVGALFEEERELTKAEQTLQQIKVIARAALDKDLFTPEEKQRLANKVNQLRAKMEHGAQMIEQAKTTIAQHKRF